MLLMLSVSFFEVSFLIKLLFYVIMAFYFGYFKIEIKNSQYFSVPFLRDSDFPDKVVLTDQLCNQ